jgi:aconitase A
VQSTYDAGNPPYFQKDEQKNGCRLQHQQRRSSLLPGDMVTTDHISPAGSFAESTPTSQYLGWNVRCQVEFNSYGCVGDVGERAALPASASKGGAGWGTALKKVQTAIKHQS